MEEIIIPFQVSKGMVILGSFTGQEEDDLYIWVRRFEGEAERKALYEAVYESDVWKNDIGLKIPAMMDRSKIVLRRYRSKFSICHPVDYTHSLLRIGEEFRIVAPFTNR